MVKGITGKKRNKAAPGKRPVPVLSILVPVYNAGKFLNLALDSIANQDLDNFEIIIINDGSTDGSKNNIEKFIKAHKNSPKFSIQFLDKKNTGYGDSMNQGLALADGKYIGIVEPDDFVHKNMFSTLFGLAEHHHADIAKCSFVSAYASGRTREEKLFHEGRHEHIETDQILDPSKDQNIFLVQPSIWSAIYRRSLLLQNDVRFEPTPGASYQDAGFQFKAFAAAKKIYCTNLPLYYYRRDNAASSVNSAAKIFAVKTEYDSIMSFLKSHHFERFLGIAAAARFKAYMWNVNRLKFTTARHFLKFSRLDFRDTRRHRLKFFSPDFVVEHRLSSAHELKFFIKHPHIYLLLRPLFRFKNFLLSSAHRHFAASRLRP